MPVFNAEKYLRDAIDSVLCQTYTDFEFLIVNDGSTDASETIIKSYSDPRIVLLSQPNGGVSSALNLGLKNARGKWIARFDADDMCLPARLAEQYSFLESHPDYIMVGSDAEYVTSDNRFVFAYHSPAYSHEQLCARILNRNPFLHSAVMYLKEPVMECGGYDLKAHTFEDHLLWVKLIRKGKMCNLNKALIKVRLNPESVTTDERLRGQVFISIRSEILEGDKPISEEQEKKLLGVIRKQNNRITKQLGYHLFVSKKYLWNNYSPQLARTHAWKCLKLNPFYYEGYFLIILSLMPKKMIMFIYNKLNRD